MEIRSLFGLPAHPLLVHAAVVLLPLAAICLIAVALIPRTRRIGAPLVLGLSILATIAVGLAEGSGEEMADLVRETELVEQHEHQAEAVLPWAALVTMAAGANLVADPLSRRLGKVSPKVVTAVVVGLAVASGVGATVTVVKVGHSGAEATWSGTLENAPTHDDGD